MTHKNDRVLSVRELARVEGEGALYLRARGSRVEEARLDIYEPPRFFEAFLRGRAHTEPPDITARICGVTVGEPVWDLRRLLYCGELFRTDGGIRAGSRRRASRGDRRRQRVPA